MASNAYKLFTDGSCLGNPGIGGTGIFLMFPEEFKLDDLRDYRGYHNTTNNRMELRASIDGLKAVRVQIKLYGRKPIEWCTDSRHVVDNLYNVRKWINNGQIRSNGEPVLNVDLWRELNGLCHSMQVSPVWISRELNKEADAMAKMGSSRPTHKDFGFSPGKVGKSLGGKGRAPTWFTKNEHILVRIFKGDGMVKKDGAVYKIRFELLKYSGGPPLEKYYAYTTEKIYNELHRTYEYILSLSGGNILEIVEELLSKEEGNGE